MRPAMVRGKLDHLAISCWRTPKFFINSRENVGGTSTPRKLNPFLTTLNGRCDGEICEREYLALLEIDFVVIRLPHGKEEGRQWAALTGASTQGEISRLLAAGNYTGQGLGM